jgi:hypothetical protein
MGSAIKSSLFSHQKKAELYLFILFFAGYICVIIATTQPTTQNNLKHFLLGGIIIGKKPTTPPPPQTTPGFITIKATEEAKFQYRTILQHN